LIYYIPFLGFLVAGIRYLLAYRTPGLVVHDLSYFENVELSYLATIVFCFLAIVYLQVRRAILIRKLRRRTHAN